jgi:hypothetical protein
MHGFVLGIGIADAQVQHFLLGLSPIVADGFRADVRDVPQSVGEFCTNRYHREVVVILLPITAWGLGYEIPTAQRRKGFRPANP